MTSVNVDFNNHKFNFLIHNPIEDRFISASISSKGCWEPELTTIWANHIQPGDYVVDIGANIGWFTRTALNQGANVISFEPDPRNFALLQQNCVGADLRNIALGDKTGELKIKYNTDGNYGDTQVSINGDITVPQDTLDNIIGNNAKNIKAVKIDVQGWEPFVINGGWNTFKNLPKGCLVLLEFSPWMIIQHGFELHCLDEFFSLFSNSKAMTHKGKPMSIDEMYKWFEKIKDNNQLYADTINII